MESAALLAYGTDGSSMSACRAWWCACSNFTPALRRRDTYMKPSSRNTSCEHVNMYVCGRSSKVWARRGDTYWLVRIYSRRGNSDSLPLTTILDVSYVAWTSPESVDMSTYFPSFSFVAAVVCAFDLSSGWKQRHQTSC